MGRRKQIAPNVYEDKQKVGKHSDYEAYCALCDALYCEFTCKQFILTRRKGRVDDKNDHDNGD